MKEKRDRTQIYFGNRLAKLRKERGLTQVDFCKMFSMYCGNAKQLLVPSVSSWEQDRRLPTVPTILNIAEFFDVSLEYLFGMTDDPHGLNQDNIIEHDWPGSPAVAEASQDTQDNLNTQISKMKSSDIPVKMAELPEYEGQPVYIHFKHQTHLDKWGILDLGNNRIVCADATVNISSKIEIYAVAPTAPFKTQISSLQQLLTNEYIWIEMKSADSDVKSLYNGRYIHNESKQCLVKIDNGLALSYNGLDVVYWAFRG